MTHHEPRNRGDMTRTDQSTFSTADHWSQLRSPFSELRTVGVSQVIEQKSIYGLSALRDIQVETGSATVTHTGSEFKLSTTANGSDRAVLDGAETGRYVPGYAVEGGIAARRPTAPTGSQALRWGLLDDDNGLAFGEDADGLFVLRRSGGTDNVVRQADWNGDSLDGSGPSGLTIDPADGHIYQIEYTWYGYGVIEYKVVVPDSRNRPNVITVHRERVKGSVSIESPNLPIRAEVDNGGTATALDLFVGGRRQHILGEYTPNRRVTSQHRLEQGSVGTTFLPAVSFRRKASVTDGAQWEKVSVKVASLQFATADDIVWQIRGNASLTGASWTTPSDHVADETSLETDISATAVSGGHVLDQGLFVTGQGNALGGGERKVIDFDFIRRQPVTLCIRKISGTGGTVTSLLAAREEF